jgi:cell division protein FtsW
MARNNVPVRGSAQNSRGSKSGKAAKTPRPLVNLAGSVQGIRGFFAKAFRYQSLQFNLTLGVTLLILVIGLVMVLSSSTIIAIKSDDNAFAIFWKQIGFAAIGLALLITASVLPAQFYWRWSRTAWAAASLIQLLTLTPLGVNVNGNHSWLKIGPFTFQPSEFSKLAMILELSRVIVANKDRIYEGWPYLRTVGIVPLVPIAFVVLGQDLGTALIMAAIAFLLIWLGGLPERHLLLPLGVTALGVFSLIQLRGNRTGRFTAWLNPNSDPLNLYTWQSQHGIWALAAGHLTGVGLGLSKLKWGWIPEVENDYIFAIIGEETGLLGALMVIGLFVVLGYSLIRIHRRSQDDFARYVVMGIAIWIVFQAFVNISVVLTILPVLGVPLPLITAGGSSLISGLLAIGVCLSFERENHLVLGAAPARRVAVARK